MHSYLLSETICLLQKFHLRLCGGSCNYDSVHVVDSISTSHTVVLRKRTMSIILPWK